MPIDAECESCDRKLKLRDELAGKRVRCPDCGEAVDVPNGSRPQSERRSRSERRQRSEKPASRKRPPNRSQSKPPRKRPKPKRVRPQEEFDDFEDDWEPAPPPRKSRPKSKQAKKGRKKKKNGKPSGQSKFLPIIAVGFAILASCAGLLSPILESRKVTNLGDTNGPMNYAAVPLPNFPDPGPAVMTFPSGVTMHSVDFGQANDADADAGFGMTMRVYRPPGNHAPGSLPCVLVAPAGTNLLIGNFLDGFDYHDETLPYAENGIVTIFYSIDGGIRNLEHASDSQLAKAYRKFRRARAGVVNGRNALEYALAKIPEVNPNQIFCAGHSSAGTLSLLLASHETRIKGCLAYAPVCDVNRLLGSILDEPGVSFLLPQLDNFLQHTSPRNHAGRLSCPLFLFHAADDSTVPINESAMFCELVKRHNQNAEFLRVNFGGHYDPMVQQGIPVGIQRIRQWSGLNAAGNSRF